MTEVLYSLSNSNEEVVIKLKAKQTSLKGFFALSDASKITLDNFQTDEVVTMELMLVKCGALKEINFGEMDVSKVQNMYGMFGVCSALTKLDASNWEITSVTNMNSMFSKCTSLKDLNIESFTESRITDPYYARNFLAYDDALEYCRYSGDVNSDMTQYFLRNCSKLISFKNAVRVIPLRLKHFAEKTLQ